MGHSHKHPHVSEKDHFNGESPLTHIVQVQANGVETSLEIHGAETPGTLFSFLDAARETVVALTIVAIIFQNNPIVAVFAFSWAFWKGARSTWLSWMRLERLHRIAFEEKREIETNRAQEREELRALYNAKGFHGDLLEEVVDVLMADQERLLRVMLQEEMGFRLHENQHPLFMGLSAFCGAFVMACFGMFMIITLSMPWIMTLSVFLSFFFGFFYARLENNNPFRSGAWSAMVSVVTFVIAFTLMKWVS